MSRTPDEHVQRAATLPLACRRVRGIARRPQPAHPGGLRARRRRVRRLGRARRLPAIPPTLDHRTLRRYLAYLDTRGFARTHDRPQGRGAARLPPLPPPPRRDRHATPAARCARRRAPARLPRVSAPRRPATCSTTSPTPSTGRSTTTATTAGAVAVVLRDLAVLEVLYGAGLRVARVLRARIGDCRPRAAAPSPCSARAPRSAGSRSASPRVDARRRLARGTAARRSARADTARRRVPQPARPARSTPAGRPADPRPPSAARRADPPPPRPAARVRYAPARRRSRSPGGAGAARPRRSGDDPDLHSRHPRPTAGRLRTRRTPVPEAASVDEPPRHRRALERLQGERHARTRASG